MSKFYFAASSTLKNIFRASVLALAVLCLPASR